MDMKTTLSAMKIIPTRAQCLTPTIHLSYPTASDVGGSSFCKKLLCSSTRWLVTVGFLDLGSAEENDARENVDVEGWLWNVRISL